MLSVIICSNNAPKFAAARRRYEALLGDAGEAYEIVHIPDAKSMCEGYNRGVRQAKGDLLVFSHDDIEILAPDFGAKVRARLKDFDVLGVAGTSRFVHPLWMTPGPPYIFGQVAHVAHGGASYTLSIFGAPAPVVGDIQALDGLLFAATRETVEQVGFDERFPGFHMYDVDFTFSAFCAGKKLGVCCDLHVIHHSVGSFDDVWRAQIPAFQSKHASRLPATPPSPRFQLSVVQVNTKAGLLETMTPPFWARTPERI